MVTATDSGMSRNFGLGQEAFSYEEASYKQYLFRG